MSKKFYHRIFPSLSEACWKKVNLDSEAAEWAAHHGCAGEKNPLIDPSVCAQFIEWVHGKHGAEASWGGYHEDRSFFLRGLYMVKNGTPLHLGIDLNVAAGVPVVFGFEGQIRVADDDGDLEGGWGPRLIATPRAAQYTRYSVIFGHLEGVSLTPGDSFSASTEVGRVGAPPRNGNWFPHLHVQLVETDLLEELIREGRLSELDGYGKREMKGVLKQRFPDPEEYYPVAAPMGTGTHGGI